MSPSVLWMHVEGARYQIDLDLAARKIKRIQNMAEESSPSAKATMEEIMRLLPAAR